MELTGLNRLDVYLIEQLLLYQHYRTNNFIFEFKMKFTKYVKPKWLYSYHNPDQIVSFDFMFPFQNVSCISRSGIWTITLIAWLAFVNNDQGLVRDFQIYVTNKSYFADKWA